MHLRAGTLGSFITGQPTETGGLTRGPGDTPVNERLSAGCVLTTEGLLVEVHEVGEDVFRDGLLIGETLEQDDHLRLAHGVHSFSRHIPALPVHVCGSRGKSFNGSFIVNDWISASMLISYQENTVT